MPVAPLYGLHQLAKRKVFQRPQKHKVIYGINDVRLNEPGAQAPAKGLGLDQYAMPVDYHRGIKVTGREFGSVPASQALLAIVHGTSKDAPRTQAERHDYARFVAGLVKAHPNIRELQVWNEPSEPLFWAGKKHFSQYVPLLATTYDKLRGSGVRVLAPGSHPGMAQQQDFVRSVRGYYKGTGRKRPLFDAYASHPYWDWDKTSRLAAAMNRQWRGLPQASPKRGLKFWWTETGMDAAGTTPPTGYGQYRGTSPPADARVMGTPEQQAKRVGLLATLAARNPLIAADFNFLLYDEPDLSRWQSGLLTPGGDRKPAYLAYQQAIKSARARGF